MIELPFRSRRTTHAPPLSGPFLGKSAAVGTLLLAVGAWAAPADAAISVSVDTTVAGADADTAPGPEVSTGQSVELTWRVTAGEIELYDIVVSDTSGVVPNCDIDGDGSPDGTFIHPGPLAPGTSFGCSATVTAGAPGETFTSSGYVRAFDFDGAMVESRDGSHFVAVGVEGDGESQGSAAQTPVDQDPPESSRPEELAMAETPEPAVSVQVELPTLDAEGLAVAGGSSLTAVVRVANTGDTPLEEIEVEARLGEGRAAAVDCGNGNGTVVGTLAAGAELTCDAVVEGPDAGSGANVFSGSVRATPTAEGGSELAEVSAEDAATFVAVAVPGALAFTGGHERLALVGLLLLFAGLAVSTFGASPLGIATAHRANRP